MVKVTKIVSYLFLIVAIGGLALLLTKLTTQPLSLSLLLGGIFGMFIFRFFSWLLSPDDYDDDEEDDFGLEDEEQEWTEEDEDDDYTYGSDDDDEWDEENDEEDDEEDEDIEDNEQFGCPIPCEECEKFNGECCCNNDFDYSCELFNLGEGDDRNWDEDDEDDEDDENRNEEYSSDEYWHLVDEMYGYSDFV